MPKQNDLPSPVTYNQKFYAKAAGMDVDLPEAITPEQKYLQAIAERGESIGNIGDVEIDNPENGEVMKYDAEQEKWVNGTASGGGGTSDYTDLTNKPKINGVTLAGNKSLDDIGAADASEVDTLLSGKVDKVTGKGLSTNDFTNAYKTELDGLDTALDGKVDKVSGKGLSTNDFTDAYKAAVDGAAPQSTTYTKDEVDAALAVKLNKSDVDAVLSDTSTNPVQNKAVQAPIARLVDAGAKNMFPINDKVIESSGNIVSQSFVLNPGVYVFTAIISGTGSTQLKFTIGSSTGETVASYSWENSSGSIMHEYMISQRSTWVTMYTNAAVTYSNMMLCRKSDYEVSPAYVPYAPTNRELYEMILALQNAQNGG